MGRIEKGGEEAIRELRGRKGVGCEEGRRMEER